MNTFVAKGINIRAGIIYVPGMKKYINLHYKL